MISSTILKANGTVLQNDEAERILLDAANVVSLPIGPEAVAAFRKDDPAVIAGTYGTLELGADGDWSYRLGNTLPATQALAQGAQGREVFTYTVLDGDGGEAEARLGSPAPAPTISR